MKRALISVSAKDGIAGFARRLVELGWEIISTGGTAAEIRDGQGNYGVPVTDVSEVTGFPQILGGRVKTLHPAIHGGLLALSDDPTHLAEIAGYGILPIGMVVVDFYPLAAAIAKPGATEAEIVEQIDIGGPAMVRAAAKGARIVICDPADRQLVLKQLEESGSGNVNDATRAYLRAKVFAATAMYDLPAGRHFSNGDFDGFAGWKKMELAYGENRDQSPAALYSTGSDDPLSWDRFAVMAGSPGYINMADGDRALQVLSLLADAFRLNFDGAMPHIAIACKHGNPCGAAIDWHNPSLAVQQAMLGDPLAVMGGEVMVNFPADEEVGEAIYRVPPDLEQRVGRKFWGPDVVFAPSFAGSVIELLGKRESRKLLANPNLEWPTLPPDGWMFRPVRGGFIRQRAPRYVFNAREVKWDTDTGRPSLFSLGSLLLAWAVGWRAVSNTVALARDNMLIGAGVGQQDRVACCRLAIERAERAGHDTQGSFFASDGFFPFARRQREDDPLEGPELLVAAGCIGGAVPADGKNLLEVADFFKERGLKVAFLPKEHRGFSQH